MVVRGAIYISPLGSSTRPKLPDLFFKHHPTTPIGVTCLNS